jgi:hypothetical protein
MEERECRPELDEQGAHCAPTMNYHVHPSVLEDKPGAGLA